MNTAVNFKIATKLKQLGFDEKCSHYYINNFQNFKHDGKLYKTSLPNDCDNDSILQFVKRTNQPHLCNAPTIAEVLMWLHERHGIWISVLYQRHSENKHWKYNIRQLNGIETVLWEHKTIEEAYEAAIEYTLKNLI